MRPFPPVLTRYRRPAVAFVAAFTFTVNVGFVHAGPMSGSQVVRGSDPEAFRARLASFFEEMQAALGSAADEAITSARDSLAVVSHEELASLERVLPKEAAFWDSWKKLRPALARQEASGFAQQSCPPDVDLETLLILRAAVTAANGAYNILQSTEPDVFGVKVGSGILAGVALAAQIALDVLDFDQARADKCNDENHESILHDVVGPAVEQNLDATVSSRATQASLDSKTTALENRLQAVDNAIQALLSLRANQLESRLQIHDADLKALVSLRANLLDLGLQTHDTAVKALVNNRANQLEALLNARATYIDTTLAHVTDMKKVDIKVIEAKEKERFLIITSEAGVPVNVNLTSIAISDLRDQGPLVLQNITAASTITPAGTGILDVRLPKAARQAKLFEFRVKHAHGTIAPIGNVDHFGVVVIHGSKASQ